MKKLVPTHRALVHRDMAGSSSVGPHDQRTGGQMFLLALAQHSRSGGSAIADELPPKCLFEDRNHVRGKSVGIKRPGNFRRMTGHFPVAGYGIHFF
jgi:hypothetical protein